MSKKFYITTTIPYVNAEPHIGFAMEVVRADTIARYHRLLGEEVIFNTGTDEHGQKIYQEALKKNKDPQKYCDEQAQKFKKLKEALNLSFTHFTRTTDSNHIKAAQEFWRRCLKNGDIYKAKYQIKYCIGCELEKTDSELEKGKCPIHPNLKIETYNEENYFFRFSKYQKKLLDFYEKNPHFVIPSFRFAEIKKFVNSGLKDFSISRIREKMPWGIEVPDDKEQVMYVWFDALINYVSTLGWPKDQSLFNVFWPGVQIAGKDNLRQQSAMWQAMLMSAGLPNSKQICIEGFITSEGQKMSKSLGNVIDPFKLIEKYGVDPIRYYLLREIPSYGDGDFSEKRFKEIYNSDLANGLGNLTARLASLAKNSPLRQGFAGHANITTSPAILGGLRGAQQNYQKLINDFRFNEAVSLIWQEIGKVDKYINDNEPWKLKGKELDKVLNCSITQLINIAYLLKSFLPETAQKIENHFTGKKEIAGPLFPRL